MAKRRSFEESKGAASASRDRWPRRTHGKLLATAWERPALGREASPRLAARFLPTGIGRLGLLGAYPADSQDDDFIYCTRTGGEGYSSFDTYYYTAVFEGDYRDTPGYETGFGDFLKANQPDLYYRHAFCFFEVTRPEAEAKRFRRQRTQEREGYRVVGTNWRPNGAGKRSDGFASRPIRDIRISVPSSPYDVRVCVRDHECEDGDRVRVSVGGRPLLSVEIVNEWACEAVSLREGRHDIELFAVNGTGFKGDCSHVDGNTGELRVAGEDSQTQSWRHRGGKGSSASIVVTVE